MPRHGLSHGDHADHVCAVIQRQAKAPALRRQVMAMVLRDKPTGLSV